MHRRPSSSNRGEERTPFTVFAEKFEVIAAKKDDWKAKLKLLDTLPTSLSSHSLTPLTTPFQTLLLDPRSTLVKHAFTSFISLCLSNPGSCGKFLDGLTGVMVGLFCQTVKVIQHLCLKALLQLCPILPSTSISQICTSASSVPQKSGRVLCFTVLLHVPLHSKLKGVICNAVRRGCADPAQQVRMEGRKVLKRLDGEGWRVEVDERVRQILQKEKGRSEGARGEGGGVVVKSPARPAAVSSSSPKRQGRSEEVNSSSDLHVDVQHSAAEQIQSSIRGVLARKSLGRSKLKQGLVFNEIKERRQSCAHVLPKPLTPDRNSTGEGFESSPVSKKEEEGKEGNGFNFMRESIGQRRQSKEKQKEVKEVGCSKARISGSLKRGSGTAGGVEKKDPAKKEVQAAPVARPSKPPSNTIVKNSSKSSLKKCGGGVGGDECRGEGGKGGKGGKAHKFILAHKISLDETMLTLKEEMNVLKGHETMSEEDYLKAARVCLEQRSDILKGLMEKLDFDLEQRLKS
ncbi:hypothetical protein TrLO_g14761 [Triparma laevis f. longispina]|uniref:CLASP N-terminal domain-containing protein n=1 Tax=Triparma laevis f. longispina TaxID=1714387 RepID=A0A9W7FGR9_9STRA|nr:hypothetical protein TrLO_g14761 [Triparma laevis f. longispina]